MRGGRILGSSAVGVLVASVGVALATATTATAAAATPTTAAAGALPAAAASPCASTPGGNDVIFTASDPTPATVTSTSGSTIATITFTSKTYFDYLYPVFSIDTRNNNDGIKPTYSPPSFEYSVNGGSWSGIAASFDTSGDVGGNVWAADLPEWKDLANGSVTTLRMKVTFNGSMPHGSYDSWFGMPATLVCGVENLSPVAAHLSPFTYSPAAAVATTRPASSSSASASTQTTGVGAGNASTAADASGTASAHAPTGSTGASASGSVSPSASGSADSGASASASGSAPTTLTNAQNAAAARTASSSGSGSGTLVWVLVLAAVVVFGGVGGTLAARRRRSRT